MIKPYTRPNLPIKDLLNPADSDEIDSDIAVHYTQTVKDSNDPRFKQPKQEEYVGIKAKGGVIPFYSAKLPPNPTLAEIIPYLVSKTLAQRLNA